MQGSALDLPFPDASFDHAYSQNVVMNIADKPRCYREAFRVLRSGGLLALANLGAGPSGPPHYPMPWAAGPDTSFLATQEQTRADLSAAGFEIVSFRDMTEEGAVEREQQRQRVEHEGFPALGVHIAMGERMREFQANVARSMAEGRLSAMEALLRKPA